MPFNENIVTDYSAVADGQYVFGTFTLTLASPRALSYPTAIWSGGDVGKTIVVGGAAGASPGGGAPLITTITAVAGDGKSLTLGADATAALPGSPAEDRIVSWGTNNASAFAAFKAANQGATGTLTIPAGTYLIGDGNLQLFQGIRNITVSGTGATLCGGTFGLGTAHQAQNNTSHARVTNVAAGATSAPFVTPSDLSRFTVGRYALMTGFDLQGHGFPSNQQRFDYVLISAKDSTSVSFATTPLTQAYQSTWPHYADGSAFEVDYGGPATLYALNADFDFTAVFNGLTIAHSSQWGCAGLSVTFNNCTFIGLYGPAPTFSGTSAFNNCTASNCTMEADKMIGSLSITGSTWSGISVQSSPIKTLTLDNTDITFTIVGTAWKTVIQNGCAIGTLAPGPIFGFADELLVSDSVISNFGEPSTHESGHIVAGGNFSENGVNVDFSMSSGVITVPNTFYSFGLVQMWMVKGANLFWTEIGARTFGAFTITEVTQDASNVYVQTNWSNGFPSRSFVSGKLRMRVHPAPKCTFRNVTGCPEVVDLSGAPTSAPLYSYTKRAYTGSIATSEYWTLWGKLAAININVITPYTGATGTVTATASFNDVTKMTDFTDASFNSVVNLKIAGQRSWTMAGGWTGTQSGDTLPTTAVNLWANSLFRMLMTDISGESSGTWPAFTVEVVTDQGLAFLIDGTAVRLIYRKI